MFEAITVVRLVLRNLNHSKRTSMGDLSAHALAGDLRDSSTLQELLAALKTLDSNVLEELITFLPADLTEDPKFQVVCDDLKALKEAYHGAGPFRSEHDRQNSVFETTIVQQRVKLNKSKRKLPKQDIEYTKIVDRLHDRAEVYFAEMLIKPQELFLHEIFIIDLRSPLKDAFTPKPRFAIERALSSPFDYLISTSETGKLSAKQPATVILCQLYLESGALVNVYDLWHTFHSVFESVEGDDCDERMTMALFYRALSELKALGIVKNSRKKTDHVAKSAWFGL